MGAGLFAVKDLPAGAVVLRLDWRDKSCAEIVAWAETNEKHQDRATAIAPRWYFSPTAKNSRGRRKLEEHHPLWFLNHSCCPNLSYRNWAKCEDHSVISLVALRKIRAGDQLTMDYSTMTTSDDGEEEGAAWRMLCHCGQPNCRKQLTEFAALPRELQREMLLTRYPVTGVVPAFIVNESPRLVKVLKDRAPRLYDSFLSALQAQQRLARHFETEDGEA
jgi:hypothetical protein